MTNFNTSSDEGYFNLLNFFTYSPYDDSEIFTELKTNCYTNVYALVVLLLLVIYTFIKYFLTQKELNKEIRLISEDPDNLAKFPFVSSYIQRIAISKKPECIKYIDNPSMKTQLLAVRTNWFAINWIKNPCFQILFESKKKEHDDYVRKTEAENTKITNFIKHFGGGK